MKILILFGLLAVLNIFSCAEVSTDNPVIEASDRNLSSMEKLPVELLCKIFEYLDHDFWRIASASRKLYAVFSTFPIKPIFARLLNILDLPIDDLSENDKELKYLLPIHKFLYLGPEYLVKALVHELIEGNRIIILLPHLLDFKLNFFDNDIDGEIVEVLFKHEMYDRFFQNYALLYIQNDYKFFFTNERILGLQQCILANPDRFDWVWFNENYIPEDNSMDLYDFSKWVTIALVNGMPDSLLLKYHDRLFEVLITTCLPFSFWIRMFVPRDRYQEMFERVNYLIDNVRSENEKEMDKEFLLLLNKIRFDPENSAISAEQIESKRYKVEKLLLICYCASLADKMNLFNRLLPQIMPYIMKNLSAAIYCFPDSENVPFDLYKFILDIHEFNDHEFSQFIYRKNDFMIILAKYCRVTSIEWNTNDKECSIVFKTPSTSIKSRIPEFINVNLKLILNSAMMRFIKGIMVKLTFDNARVFEGFMLDYFQQFGIDRNYISGENLKLLLKSETINKFVNETMTDCRPYFEIKMDELMKFVDEPIPPSVANYKIVNCSALDLSKFKTPEQLQRIETLLGRSISEFIKYHDDYFKNRHVYKYLISSGQELPKKLSVETLLLLKIDFPIAMSRILQADHNK